MISHSPKALTPSHKQVEVAQGKFGIQILFVSIDCSMNVKQITGVGQDFLGYKNVCADVQKESMSESIFSVSYLLQI